MVEVGVSWCDGQDTALKKTDGYLDPNSPNARRSTDGCRMVIRVRDSFPADFSPQGFLAVDPAQVLMRRALMLIPFSLSLSLTIFFPEDGLCYREGASVNLLFTQVPSSRILSPIVYHCLYRVRTLPHTPTFSPSRI
jgi:hypothetical protein